MKTRKTILIIFAVFTLVILLGLPFICKAQPMTYNQATQLGLGKIYYDFDFKGYVIDSAGSKWNLTGARLDSINKYNLNQRQSYWDSLIVADPGTYTDTIFCDKIYVNVQYWSLTNIKFEPLSLLPRTVNYLLPFKTNEGMRYWSDDGTLYDVVWYRMLNGNWMPLKSYCK